MEAIKTFKNKGVEIWNHSGFQKYFRNTGWMFGGRIFSLLISFFVSVFMARSMGPENYGTLSFVTSFVGVFGASLLVIDSILFKKINDKPEEIQEILGTAVAIKLISSVGSVIIPTVISVVFASSQYTTLLVFTFSTFTIFQILNPVETFFQANVQAKKITTLSITTNIVSSCLKILFIYLGLDLFYILSVYVFDQFITMIGLYILYRINIGKIINWKFSKICFLDLVRKSWPFTLSALAMSIYLRIDQIFLKLILGSESLGLYTVPVRLSEVWFVIPSVICASTLPAVLNSKKVSEDIFNARAKMLYSLLFYTSLFISVFIFLFSPIIIKYTFGQAYLESVPVLQIYVWSIVGSFLGFALQQILLAQNNLKTILIYNLIGMFTSLLLNWLLIPLLGIRGAAFANVVAYTLPIVVIFNLSFMKKQRRNLILAIIKPFN